MFIVFGNLTSYFIELYRENQVSEKKVVFWLSIADLAKK